MEIRKVLIVAIGLLLIGGVVYWITKDSAKTTNVVFFTLGSTSFTEEVKREVSEKINVRARKINIIAFDAESQRWPIVQLRKTEGPVNQKDWSSKLLESLDSTIQERRVSEDSDRYFDDYFEVFIQKISEMPANEQLVINLDGMFPACFDTSRAKSVVEKIRLKLQPRENTVLFWRIEDTRTGEKIVLDALSGVFKNAVINKSVPRVPSRKCPGEQGSMYAQVDLLVFSPMDTNQANQVIDQIYKRNPDFSQVTIVQGNSSQSLETYKLNRTEIKSELLRSLLNAPQTEWKEAKFMVQQIVNKYKMLPDTLESQVLLVGTINYKMEEWVKLDTFKNRRNPKFFVHVKSNKKGFDLQQTILNSFKHQNLEISAF